MKHLIIMFSISILIAACGGGGGGGSNTQPPLGVSYVNGTATAAGVMGVSPTTGEQNVPLLFYGVGVRAYQYGARAAMVGEKQNAAWSSWNIIPFEVFYLPDGGTASLATNFTEFDAAQDYINNVGTFSFDFLVARGEPSPININNSVCGANSVEIYQGQAAEFPQLNFGVCQHRNVVSSVDGKAVFQVRGIFARKDWFPSTFQVYLGADPAAVDGLQCYETSAPINTLQEELLTSLLNLELEGQYTVPIFYYSGCLAGTDIGGVRSPVDLPITVIPQTPALLKPYVLTQPITRPPFSTTYQRSSLPGACSMNTG